MYKAAQNRHQLPRESESRVATRQHLYANDLRSADHATAGAAGSTVSYLAIQKINSDAHRRTTIGKNKLRKRQVRKNEKTKAEQEPGDTIWVSPGQWATLRIFHLNPYPILSEWHPKHVKRTGSSKKFRAESARTGI